MKMFARIFISFSAATVLSIAVSGAFVVTHKSDVSAERSRAIPVGQLRSCALSAVHASAAKRETKERMPTCGEEYLIDSHDRDAFSRPVAGSMLALVDVARRNNEIELTPLLGKMVAVIPVHDDEAGQIVIVYAIPSPGAPPIGPLAWQLVPFAFAAAFICYFLTGYIVKPLQRLGRVADDLGRGDLSVRTDETLTNRRDEFGDLAKAFDRMAARIESLVLNQKMFLAHVSHELGSPLTRLNMRLALARRKAPAELISELDRIGKESEEINHLVQQLLLLARLESGNEVDTKLEQFFVSSVLNDIIANANFEAQQSGRILRLVRTEDFCVTGNRELLKRAVENVVRNALRFAPQGSVVEVEFFHESDRGWINIRDEGPGVEPQDLAEIFQPFARSEASGGHAGVGLGLAIARQAVLAHGGEISARNLKRGLVVTINLPITRLQELPV